MGFSLEMFFEELLQALTESAKNEASDAARDLRRIEEIVIEAKKYAIQCGKICTPSEQRGE